jgi:ankyrin repeat protein
MSIILSILLSTTLILTSGCTHSEVKESQSTPSPSSPPPYTNEQRTNEQMSLYLSLKDPEHYPLPQKDQSQPVNFDKANINGTTVLMFAAFRGDLAVVKALLEKKASVNLRDKQWSSEFHYAVLGFPNLSALSEKQRQELIAQKIEICKRLVENHADLNLQDSFGITPLRLAVQVSPIELVKFLLDSGANPNAADSDLYTPLHYAANNSKIELIQLLLKYKADPSLKDSENQSPLDLAKENGDEKVISLLKNN